MKKCSLLFLFAFFLLDCSDDKADMPRLELKGLFLNGAEENYSRNLEEILPLAPGDYVDVSFLLDGKESDLKTFVVKNDNENVRPAMSFSPDEVSDEFTELPERLGYKDGVRSTYVTVKLTILGAEENRFRVGFYLNSKALHGKAAVYYLDLETTTEPRASEKE